MQFEFPEGMRPASVAEREQYYREAFPIETMQRLVQRWNRLVPVIDVGSESTLYKPRFKRFKGKLVRLTDYNDIDDLREKIISYAPEDVYYVTTIEKENEVEVNPEQELVFDLDPERTRCRQCERKDQYRNRKQKEHSFCLKCFKNVAAQTRHLYAVLENHFHDIRIIYSGRGFHIHVWDEEGFAMKREDRQELATRLGKEFPIDEDVAAGETDLIRMPGSLHGLVSRTATPVTVDDLSDPDAIVDAAVPGFLTH